MATHRESHYPWLLRRAGRKTVNISDVSLLVLTSPLLLAVLLFGVAVIISAIRSEPASLAELVSTVGAGFVSMMKSIGSPAYWRGNGVPDVGDRRQVWTAGQHNAEASGIEDGSEK
ncbi:hypothetical protein [Actinomycetospora aeridis]|uniref:Uncharacterized protein n=1 Tax=Actinomycetospora aeridis TaxID=3129231 RepID=A0ABU8N796_9PSEU